MVREGRVELPRALPTSSSGSRVCQFRHSRVCLEILGYDKSRCGPDRNGLHKGWKGRVLVNIGSMVPELMTKSIGEVTVSLSSK